MVDLPKPDTKVVIVPVGSKLYCLKCAASFILTKVGLITVPRDDESDIGYSCNSCNERLTIVPPG